MMLIRWSVPLAGRRGRRDRDAALLLLLHPVHRGRALVDLADLVGAAGVVEDPLGRRRLAGVDVGHDPDVAGLLEGELARHGKASLSVCWRACPVRAKKTGRSGPCIQEDGPRGWAMSRGLHGQSGPTRATRTDAHRPRRQPNGSSGDRLGRFAAVPRTALRGAPCSILPARGRRAARRGRVLDALRGPRRRRRGARRVDHRRARHHGYALLVDRGRRRGSWRRRGAPAARGPRRSRSACSGSPRSASRCSPTGPSRDDTGLYGEAYEAARAVAGAGGRARARRRRARSSPARARCSCSAGGLGATRRQVVRPASAR